jgi:hypothetical protein
MLSHAIVLFGGVQESCSGAFDERCKGGLRKVS